MAPQMGMPSACVPVGIDNSAAKCLIEDPISAARTKHIEIVFHHVREKVKRQQMSFISVRTADNTADYIAAVYAILCQYDKTFVSAVV